MPDVVVPAAPPLARVHSVELMHAGQWTGLYGTHEYTASDLAASVAALDCPAVRNPILKFGHDGNHGAGDPAIGWVDNMATTDDGRTLIGDFAGMPGWLADLNDDGTSVLVSAYPDRSIEGTFGHKCQIGHVHDFVILAVALLGQDRPGIGTLPSLQTLAELYGVQLAAPPSTGGTPVTVTLSAGGHVPDPQPVQVAAGVTTEDVRRAYYDGPGSSWSLWIEEFHLDPMQLIVTDDNSGKRTRVPVTIGDGDGTDAVSFGDPVTVVIRYEDAPTGQAAASAPTVTPALRFASRAQSRPAAASEPAPEAVVPPPSPPEGEPVAEPLDPETAPPADPAGQPDPPEGAPAPQPPAEPGNTPNPEEEDGMADLKAGLRQRLGITQEGDVTDDAFLAALDEALTERAEPAAASVAGITPPPGYTLVPTVAWEETTTAASAAVQTAIADAGARKRAVLATAEAEGKIRPNDEARSRWSKAYDVDPTGTATFLASVAPVVVPVKAAGYTGGDGDDSGEQAVLAAMAKSLGVTVEEFVNG